MTTGVGRLPTAPALLGKAGANELSPPYRASITYRGRTQMSDQTIRWSAVSDPVSWGSQSLELPSRVLSLTNVDGRMIAVVEGGKSIDVTDWFPDTAARPN